MTLFVLHGSCIVCNKLLIWIGNASMVTLSQIDFRVLSYSSSMYIRLVSTDGAVFVKQL